MVQLGTTQQPRRFSNVHLLVDKIAVQVLDCTNNHAEIVINEVRNVSPIGLGIQK